MKRQKSGFVFHEELEIIKCSEGNKDCIKERQNKRSEQDQYFLIAEFPLYDETKIEKTWRFAKNLAYDFLRTELIDAVIVSHMPLSEDTGRAHDCICVFGKYVMS